jgi:hypothetical protein
MMLLADDSERWSAPESRDFVLVRVHLSTPKLLCEGGFVVSLSGA